MNFLRVFGHIATASLLAATLAACQTSGTSSQSIQQVTSKPDARPFAAEDKDWGVAPQDTVYKGRYHAPTPTRIPGAAVLSTHALAQMVAGPDKPVMVNVLTGRDVNAITDSVWLSGAGQGSDFSDATQTRLATRLEELTGGNKAKPVVFYCLSSECWLSYNAALRAARLGYARVGWYRGGVDAWKAAGLPMATVSRDQW